MVPTATHPAAPRRRPFLVLAWLLVAAAVSAPTALAAEGAPWAVIGQQGVVRFIVVPSEQAAQRSAYDREVSALCEPERTCFLNFYTNSTGAPVAVPLPDAIANEATATFRRSAKQGAERFMWSCRMKQAGEDCF